MLVTQRMSDDALFHELDGRPGGRLPDRRLRRAAPARRGDLRRPPPGARDRRRGSRGRAALPARARRRQRQLPPAAAPAPLAVLPPRPQPARRTCEFVDDAGAAAERIDALLRAGRRRRGRRGGPRRGRCDRALAGAWPSATARASRSRGRRSRPAARPAPSWSGPRANRRPAHLPGARHLGRVAASRRHGREPDRRRRQPRPRRADLRVRRSGRGRPMPAR